MATIALTLLRVVLAPIGIRGAAAWLVSVSTGVALASVWSGVAWHRLVSVRLTAFAKATAVKPSLSLRPGKPDTTYDTASVSALDAWLAPITASRSRLTPAIGLVLAPLAIHFLISRVATFDWEFMLQKLATLALWLVAFGFIHALTRDPGARRPLWMAPVVVLALFAAGQVLLPRLPALAGDERLNPEFTLDAYAAMDPSFRIARDTLGSGTTGDTAEFFAYLRANATIENTHVDPVDVDFVQRWTRSSERPPNVFLFMIDSLRRDYVSSYNHAVSFTPAMQAFAGDSLVFTRAFSRYAGTGLAVPSIFAGAMVIHKQYVTPFARMNALEKLVVAKGYRRFITEDHIADELFAASSGTVGLDHHVPEMMHTFCRTMGELNHHLESLPNGPPVFAMTRPLDLHIGNIVSAKVPPGESYPGFHGPYAARVRRIDACFGEFIETLKRTRLYDNSVIILTSDHGDSLGEGQRWGHGFTAFPEVLRIPLIIHVPASLRARMSADLGRLSFSTDITPTLYALLGEPPSTDGPRGIRHLLMGSPLLADPSTDLSWRRRESYLVASSYGPVFGLLGHNGRRLYLADAVEAREYAYELGPDGTDVRVGMTDAGTGDQPKSDSPTDWRDRGVVPLHSSALTIDMILTPSVYALIGLTAIVACLVAILTFALLRLVSVARDTRRSRSSGAETVLLSAALQEAVGKLKLQERAMTARAEASERLSGEIISSLTAGAARGRPQWRGHDAQSGRPPDSGPARRRRLSCRLRANSRCSMSSMNA